jgi:ubiquitin C-terminal hydrolase
MRIRGLPNEGNTCYLNSVLQILCSSREIVAHIIQKEQITGIFNLIKAYTSNTEVVKPSKYFNSLPFEPYLQHDAHEALIYFMKYFSKICKIHGILHKRPFKERMLSLSVEKSLYRSLQVFLEPKGSITSWPMCLFLHFKRYGGLYHDEIDLPVEWRIVDKKNKLKKYKLRSFIYHTGDSNGEYGHYVAVIKRKGRFFVCDDLQVREVSEKLFFRLLKRSYIVLYCRDI